MVTISEIINLDDSELDTIIIENSEQIPLDRKYKIITVANLASKNNLLELEEDLFINSEYFEKYYPDIITGYTLFVETLLDTINMSVDDDLMTINETAADTSLIPTGTF